MASDIIVERILDYRDGATNRPVMVRIHRPEQRGSGWICTTELEGSREPGSLFVGDHYGDDSMGALFEALSVLRIAVKNGYMTYKGKNPWPISSEPSDLIDSSSAPGLAAEVMVERVLQTRDSQPVTFRIRKPVQHGPSEWSCVFECEAPDGLRRFEAHGVDSAQALFLALSAAKTEATIRMLSHDGHNPWEIRAEPLELLPWRDSTAEGH
jgi:hypothetical protein